MTNQQLILIPGLLCDETVFAPVINTLDGTARTLVPDLSNASSITAMAEKILVNADSRFSLLGFSMGARVALEMIRLAPERVERLALLDTGVHPAKQGEAEKRQRLVDLAYTDGMLALAQEWLPPMLAPANRGKTEIINSLCAMVCKKTAEDHERQIKALLGRPDAMSVLATIQCPTLVGVGEEDQWSPVEQHQLISQNIVGARLEVFSGAGHFALVEMPDAVCLAIQQWMGFSEGRPGC